MKDSGRSWNRRADTPKVIMNAMIIHPLVSKRQTDSSCPLLRNPAGMFPVESVKDESEKQKKDEAGLADLEQPIGFIIYPAGNPDT